MSTGVATALVGGFKFITTYEIIPEEWSSWEFWEIYSCDFFLSERQYHSDEILIDSNIRYNLSDFVTQSSESTA